jgi:hypothetical protein
MRPSLTVEYLAWMYKNHVHVTRAAGNEPDTLRLCVRKTLHSNLHHRHSKKDIDFWTAKTQEHLDSQIFVITDEMRAEGRAADFRHRMILQNDYE